MHATALTSSSDHHDDKSTLKFRPLVAPSLNAAYAYSLGFTSAPRHPRLVGQARWMSTDAAKKAVVSNVLARRSSTRVAQQEDRLDKALEKVGERGFQVKDLQNLDLNVSAKAWAFIKSTPALVVGGAATVQEWVRILVKEPERARAWLKQLKESINHELKHYWVGSKLLYAELSTSTRILRRILKGNALTRREKKQLQRTVADILRLIPFAFFLIVPFMELALPFALKLFPNMLPSTFKHAFQREEDMKRQLQLRVSLAEFLQDTRGEPLTSEETLKIAGLFNDEITLDNISRPQLVGMCRYMGVNPYGNDNFLRFQLRMKIAALKKDDQVAINGSSNHSTRTSEVLELLQHAWVLLEAAADQRSQELLLSSYFTQDTPHKQPKAKCLVSSTPPAIPTTTTTTASTKKKKKSKAKTNRQRTSAAGANKDSLVTKHFTDDSKEDSTDEPTVVCVQKPPSPQHSITAQVKPNSNVPSDNDDDEGQKDVTDDEADVLYDTFPLFRTMGISLAHFALHELDGLSMAQLDMLQDAHMHAFTVIGDKKVQVARQLEADRIHAAYELEQHIFNLG
ncbi:hypothetical protein B5M09_007957 [Aphanomyces astaci]|uniref:Letm1 RBD domain-containing protein n=1 Tax=Aphanomyces astaci TaxID=112090 RepID=A0A3R7WI98_APHAT|nr:hypothetical protein B5M09_007957 [Aphanomyces astaci]